MDKSKKDLEARIDEVSRGSGVTKEKVRSWLKDGAQFGGLTWDEALSVDELTLPREEARIFFYLRLTQK